MKKITIVLIALLSLFILSCTQVQPAQPPVTIPKIEIIPPAPLPDKPQYEPPPTPPTMPSQPSEPGQKVVEVQMDVNNHDFLPNELNFRKGDHVRLVITSREGSHTFTLTAYRIDQPLPLGQDVVVEFTADKIGSFFFNSKTKGDELLRGKLSVR